MPRSDPTTFRILFVGDVHGQWSDADGAFLENGDQDLVLFVGDLGDEDVDVVRQIAALDCELGVMLGNHDAWESFSQRRPTAALREILELLGEDHLAYTVRELPEAGLTLLGARPFSWGGRDLRSPEIYTELYDVETQEDSAHRLVELAAHARHGDILVLAHNGPRGLGSGSTDIYGKDFGKPGGDWGDRDLQWALREIRETGRRVRAVVAGHMHHRVFAPRGALRTRFVRHGATDHLNAAVVPRVRKAEDGTLVRHFLRTDWKDGELVSVDEIWIDAHGEIRKVDVPAFQPAGARR